MNVQGVRDPLRRMHWFQKSSDTSLLSAYLNRISRKTCFMVQAPVLQSVIAACNIEGPCSVSSGFLASLYAVRTVDLLSYSCCLMH